MLLKQNRVLHHQLLKNISVIVLVLFFSSTVFAQVSTAISNTKSITLNPILSSAFKKPLKANPLLQDHLKPSQHELMFWPNYPLTAAQIQQRDQKNNRPPGQQIADDIISNYVNAIIYGKKSPVAVRPKF